MNRINIRFGEKEFVNKIFKKSKITSLQHLSYLWLIGVNKLEPLDANKIYKDKIGKIYHQTLNRTKENNIIKYTFYSRLYYKNNNINEINKIFGYEFEYILKKINILEILDIFYHSGMDFIGIPKDKIMYIEDNISIDLKKYNKNHKDAYFVKKSKILLNVNYYCYLKNNKKYNKDEIINIEITSEDIKKLTFIFYELCINKKIKEHYYDNIDIVNNIKNIKIKLENNNKNIIGYLFMINCNIIDNNIIGTLENVEIK